MKLFRAILWALCAAFCGISAQARTSFILSDSVPAPKWDEGYGVGNGRLGALTLGGFPKDLLVLNEASIFERKAIHIPADVPAAIEEARRACEAGADGHHQRPGVSRLSDDSVAGAGAAGDGGM